MKGATLSLVSLAITNTVAAPVVLGQLNVHSGMLLLPTLRFRVSGVIQVAYDGRYDPTGEATAPIYLDLVGTTHLAVRQNPGLSPEDVELILLVRGSPTGVGDDGAGDDPQPALPSQLLFGGQHGLSIELRSDPPLPAHQLTAMIRQELGVEGILANETNLQAVVEYQVQRVLANAVAPLLTSPVEEYVQRALGRTTFSIDVGSSQEPLQLRIGKRLFGGLYGSWTQQLGITGESRQAWELSYRLTRRLRLGFRQEEPDVRQLFFLSGSLRFR